MAEQQGFKWENRRRWVARVLTFLIVAISLCLSPVVSDAKAAVALPSLCALLGGVISAYIFGAAWEHTALAKGGG